MPIQSFSCAETQALFENEPTAKFQAFKETAERKLFMLATASLLKDLSKPPGNKLHPLYGDRAGQHAIRINDQYRICFIWTPAGPADVEIVDYH